MHDIFTQCVLKYCAFLLRFVFLFRSISPFANKNAVINCIEYILTCNGNLESEVLLLPLCIAVIGALISLPWSLASRY